jgi:hypothetical protein
MHIIIHNEAGEIRNKYRPVTDFVRVVSVCACPKPMTVDTPVIILIQVRDGSAFNFPRDATLLAI